MSEAGWSDLYETLHGLDKATLVEALANDNFVMEGDEGRAFLNTLVVETLADEAYRRILDHRMCSNGGHEIWIDRGGFVTVTLP